MCDEGFQDPKLINAIDVPLPWVAQQKKRNLFDLQLHQGALETFHQIFYQKDSGVIADCEPVGLPWDHRSSWAVGWGSGQYFMSLWIFLLHLDQSRRPATMSPRWQAGTTASRGRTQDMRSINSKSSRRRICWETPAVFLSLLPCRTTARSRWKWKARKNSWKTRISAQSDMANYVISCTAICIGNTMNRWTLMDFMDLECAPSLAKRQSQEQSWPLRSGLHMSTPLSCRVFLVKLLPDMQDVSHVSWIAAFSKRPQEVCFSQTWYAPLPTSALFLHRGTVS